MGQSRWKKITQTEETLKKYLETITFLGRRVKELGMQIVFPSIFAVNNHGTKLESQQLTMQVMSPRRILIV